MKNIIIFGAGYHGRMAFRKLCEKKNFVKNNNIAFIDNSIKNKKKKIFQKTIFKPITIFKKQNIDQIILCGRYIRQQYAQLKNYNFDENKIKIWGRKELKPKKNTLEERLNKYLIILKKIFLLFEKEKIMHWADYSGLLAIMRNQNIAEMSDFDLCFDAKDTKKIIKILRKIKGIKLDIRYHFKSKINGKTYPQIVVFGKCNFKKMEPPTIDLIPRLFYENKNEELKLYKNIVQSSKYWSGFKVKKYKNLNINLPLNAKKYLKKLYGIKWNIEENFWYAS